VVADGLWSASLLNVWNAVSRFPGLPGAEGDDAPDRIVRRNANRDSITRNDLDSEPPHAATQLREHFMSCVTLHTI
jgi:hypothetical protein